MSRFIANRGPVQVLAPTGSARRRLLRSIAVGVPRIGASWLHPYVGALIEKGPKWPWYRRLFARREARRINRAIDAGIEHVCLVYDCGVCPLTYGDYLHFVMIMRYLGERDIGATLYLLDSDIYPLCRAIMNDEEIEGFLQEMVEIGGLLLPYPKVQTKRVHELREVMEFVGSHEAYVVCGWQTRHRRSLFHHGFNIFNHLMASAPSELQDRVLLSSSDLAQVALPVDVPSPRVAWHVRHSDKDPSRNLTTEEFLDLHEILRSRHPDHTIIVVSDDAGCQHCSELVEEHRLGRTVFSKDYSMSFLGDAALVLGSDLYCVLRGGGMNIVPIMSRMPYRCTSGLAHELMWSADQLTSWQGPKQRYAVAVDLKLARAMLMS